MVYMSLIIFYKHDKNGEQKISYFSEIVVYRYTGQCGLYFSKGLKY